MQRPPTQGGITNAHEFQQMRAKKYDTFMALHRFQA
jgi:hypothetical protein